MRKNFMSFLIVLAIALPGQASLLKSDQPNIIISGQGTVKARADVAYVTVGVEKTEKTATEAQKAAARKMNNVLASLEKSGLAKNKIETSRVSLYPQYKYDKGKRTLTGYTARHDIKVTIDDLVRLGSTIDSSIAGGATNIDSVSFSLKDQAPFKKAALQKAFADAKGKAEIIAAASGLVLSKIKRIQEAEAQVFTPTRRLRAFAAEAGAGSKTPISPGKVEVQGHLTVVYECSAKK